MVNARFLGVLITVLLLSSVGIGAYFLGIRQASSFKVADETSITSPSSSPITQHTTEYTPTATPSPAHKPWNDFNVYYDIAPHNNSSIVVDMDFNGFCFKSPITSDLSIDSFSLCINGTIVPTHIYSKVTSFPVEVLKSFNGTNLAPEEIQVTYTFDVDVSQAGFRSYSVPVLTYNGPYSIAIIPAI